MNRGVLLFSFLASVCLARGSPTATATCPCAFFEAPCDTCLSPVLSTANTTCVVTPCAPAWLCVPWGDMTCGLELQSVGSWSAAGPVGEIPPAEGENVPCAWGIVEQWTVVDPVGVPETVRSCCVARGSGGTQKCSLAAWGSLGRKGKVRAIERVVWAFVNGTAGDGGEGTDGGKIVASVRFVFPNGTPKVFENVDVSVNWTGEETGPKLSVMKEIMQGEELFDEIVQFDGKNLEGDVAVQVKVGDKKAEWAIEACLDFMYA